MLSLVASCLKFDFVTQREYENADLKSRIDDFENQIGELHEQVLILIESNSREKCSFYIFLFI